MAFTCEQGIGIDGKTYMLPIKAASRTADFLDKYANRSEDGDLKRELIGVYYNFEFEIDEPDDESTWDTYNAFFEDISQAKEFRTITVPWHKGQYTFKAYISGIGDSYSKILKNKAKFSGLKLKFKAKAPAHKATSSGKASSGDTAGFDDTDSLKKS